MNDVYIQSCERMTQLADETVDLTVTSPPYANAIDYERHAVDPGSDYRPRHAVPYAEYLAFLDRAFGEVLRVTRPGSFCAVVMGTLLEKGVHTPVPFHFVSRMESLGWQFHQDIVWSKVTGGVKRAGSTIRHPAPGYYYPNLMTETILVFRRPGERRIYDGRSREQKHADGFDLDTVFLKDIANNVWHVAPVPPKQIDHPCPFPEEIAYRLVRLYSYSGDLVLDPFCGAGTVLKVAHHLRRRWVGYEVVERYREMSLDRVCEPLVLRQQLIPVYERVSYGERALPRSENGRRRLPFQHPAQRRRKASE